MIEVVVTTGAIRRKIVTINKPTPIFTGWMPSCSSTNSVKALKGKFEIMCTSRQYRVNQQQWKEEWQHQNLWGIIANG